MAKEITVTLTEKSRKHAEMQINAIANPELVTFYKSNHDNIWVKISGNDISWIGDNYLLCLPQHKEACLHWLNGGDVEGEDPNNLGSFDDYANFCDRNYWRLDSWYMRKDRNVRIKQ